MNAVHLRVPSCCDGGSGVGGVGLGVMGVERIGVVESGCMEDDKPQYPYKTSRTSFMKTHPVYKTSHTSFIKTHPVYKTSRTSFMKTHPVYNTSHAYSPLMNNEGNRPQSDLRFSFARAAGKSASESPLKVRRVPGGVCRPRPHPLPPPPRSKRPKGAESTSPADDRPPLEVPRRNTASTSQCFHRR